VLLLLSGVSGSGKSTACALAARYAAESGRPVGGVVCTALFDGGRKSAIACAPLREGTEARPEILARARPDWVIPRPPSVTGQPAAPVLVPFDDTDPHILRYGMWAFDKAVLARADQTVTEDLSAFSTATGMPPLLIVDEIGPLELDKSTGMIESLRMLDGLAAGSGKEWCQVVVARPDIAARLGERWPGSITLGIESGQSEQVARDIIRRLEW